MPSGQDYGNRLREDVRLTLAQHLARLEEQLRNFKDQVSASVDRVSESLVPVRDLKIDSADSLFQEAIRETEERKDQDLGYLSQFAADLRRKETQEDILKLLLDGASRFAPRIALFIARGEQCIAWASRGFSENAAQQLGQLVLPQSESPLLRDALAGDGPATAEDLSQEQILLPIVGAEAAPPWHAFPLRALRRPLATLLAAPEAGKPCDLQCLAVVMSMTGMCLENLALKILHDLSVSGAPPQKAAPVAQPPQAPVEPVPAKTAGATPGAAGHDAPVVEPARPTSGQAGIHSGASVAGAAESAVRASTEAQVGKVGASAGFEAAASAVDVVRELSEEERLHSDAKRFARLLVSEIKLYNEQRVAEGRQNKDLYVRLKRDIDRSRDMYEKRVSPVVARKVDYFHDEVIRILGENDPSTLGADYPGPRVGS